LKSAFVVVVACGLFVGCASSKPVTTTAPQVTERPAPPPERVERDDGLEVAGTLGTVKEEDVERVFKARFAEILDCVKQGKGTFRYLGGSVDVKVKLDQQGAPQQSWLVASSLGHRAAEACIEKIVAQLRFAPPKGGKEAEFNYPVDFGGSGEVATWDGARVELRMKPYKPHVRECKKRGKGGLPPGLSITMYIGPGGRVLSAGLAAEAPVPGPIADCLVEKARLLRLDDPLGRVAKATVPVSE
jgi:hypothetical protein